MPVQIPFVPSVPSYRMSVVLDNTQYIFDVQWNNRDLAWYFDVLDVNENPIYMGIKVVLGTYLGRRCADPNFPRGVMFANDLSGQGFDAGIDDLGGRVQVWYYLPSEALSFGLV